MKNIVTNKDTGISYEYNIKQCIMRRLDSYEWFPVDAGHIEELLAACPMSPK